jgi:uncharacterized Zn-binding protein involved in type VI secretion
MANVFNNATVEATTSGALAYTVPSSTTTVILGINLANKSALTVKGSVQLGTSYIIKDAVIPAGSALSVLDGKIIATAGDTITVTSDTNSAVDFILSVMESS